ncbi:MAG TPA: aldo/keto reductase [Thermoanaerobaculia bacterium]|jgi:diketogulonate reductase-like aldo/keto reductase|nr:aldo/keto reductase [Thermoanaerobaculia bacterium]
MKTRAFGPIGEEVAVVGQGTWNLERDDRRAALAALRRGLDAGMTHVDTAEMYGDGRVEEIVGEALVGRRDEVFLVSKVLPQNASRRGTVQACGRSLHRLRTDHLDCYLLHWPGSYPLKDTLAAFEELVAAGKIRSWGLSNFDEEGLARAVALAGPDRVACNQVLYHLQERAIEHAVIPFCAEHDIAVVAYSPFGSGEFPSPGSAGGRVLAEIAKARGATPHQIALAFLLRLPSLFAIPKAANAEHAADNAAAAEIELSEDEVRRLDRAFPRGPRRKGVPTL